MTKSVGIVGLGLIGGSLAEAIRRFLPEVELMGADNNPATLEEAKAAALFTSLSSCPDASWQHLDLVIVSVPLGVFEPVLKQLKSCIGPDTLVTDVIGVKTPVVNQAKSILNGSNAFVGSHPMAGGIVPGFAHRKADLFQGFPVAVCGSADDKAARNIFSFWESLKAEPLYMTADEHDRVVAFTSHLPYLSSVVLREFAENDSTTQGLRGPGFQRATRYAAFLPEIMGPVVAGNPHVPELLREFAQRFEKLAQTLENNPEDLIENLSKPDEH